MSERTPQNECYSCKHRRNIPGDCHSQCAKPSARVTGNPHGYRMGWFFYPFNFDPVWKTNLCDNYETRGEKSGETN